MKSEMLKHLVDDIIPFCDKLSDYENGGFSGYVSSSGNTDKTYPKSAVLHLRILWFYSSCFLKLKETEGSIKLLEKARHCYEFVMRNFVDGKYGGLYMHVSPQGTPFDTVKHTYSHAFFIYAMCAFFEACGDKEVLKSAFEVFDVLGEKAPRYEEKLDREWHGDDNQVTTGALMHLVEAYTQLYRVCDTSDKARVAERINPLLRIFTDDLFCADSGRLFEISRTEETQNNRIRCVPSGDVYSYGHFAEAAWLFNVTLDVFGDKLSSDLYEKVSRMCRTLIDTTDKSAFDTDGSMFYEQYDEYVERKKVWWTHAEGIAGFLDAYNRYGDEKYLARAQTLWEFVKCKFIDKNSGEWFNELDQNNQPDLEMPLVNEWKCPYHNGRMALWVLENF
jgi:mannobiose 2-epimerase